MINNQKIFSKRAALGFAFEALKNNFGILSLITLLIFGAYFAISFKEFPEIINIIESKTPKGVLWGSWILVIFKILFLPNFCLITLKIYDQFKIDSKDFIPKISAIWKLLVIYLLTFFVSPVLVIVGAIIGLLLMITIKANSILGNILLSFSFLFFMMTLTYLYLKLKLFVFAIVDKSADPLEALKYSWKITKGNSFNLFILSFMLNAIPSIICAWVMLAAFSESISISMGQIILAVSYILHFFTSMVLTLTDAYAYRQLSPKEEIQTYEQ